MVSRVGKLTGKKAVAIQRKPGCQIALYREATIQICWETSVAYQPQHISWEREKECITGKLASRFQFTVQGQTPKLEETLSKPKCSRDSDINPKTLKSNRRKVRQESVLSSFLWSLQVYLYCIMDENLWKIVTNLKSSHPSTLQCRFTISD